VASAVSPVRFARDYGHCERCRAHVAPAEGALGCTAGGWTRRSPRPTDSPAAPGPSSHQRRFKLTGQFWSLEGDEAFLSGAPSWSRIVSFVQ